MSLVAEDYKDIGHENTTRGHYLWHGSLPLLLYVYAALLFIASLCVWSL